MGVSDVAGMLEAFLAADQPKVDPSRLYLRLRCNIELLRRDRCTRPRADPLVGRFDSLTVPR